MILNKCEILAETPIDLDNGYYSPFEILSNYRKQDNDHRKLVGGPIEHWDEIGTHHLDILKSHGLQSNMKILDVGCGSMRVGCKLIEYLDPNNYYGIDVNLGLVEAGLNYEVPKYNLQNKITSENFIITDDFSFEDFNVKFDFGFAHSVFTHLHYDKLKLFLSRSHNLFNDDAKLIITFLFSETPDLEYKKVEIAEPYRYSEDIVYAIADETTWQVEKLFDSTYDQTYMLFTKANK